MTTKLIMMRGLPGSGKSTYAVKLLQELNDINSNKPTVVRINKDMMRDMLTMNHFFGSDDLVNAAMYRMIESYLERGVSVISDNMNLDPKHYEAYEAIIERVNYRRRFSAYALLEVRDIETPMAECIVRDSKRERPVGAETITGLQAKYATQPTANGFHPIPRTTMDWMRLS